jgi:hypothetical protein
VIVIPESGRFLLEGIGGDVGFAGDEPVFREAIVFGGGAAAVEMDARADVGDVMTAAVERVIDGKEVLGGEVVDPFDLKRLVSADINEGGEGGVSVAPHPGRGNIAVGLGLDFAHGDAEVVRVEGGDWLGALEERELVDEGSE